MGKAVVLALLLSLPLGAAAAAQPQLLDVTLAPPAALGLPPLELLDEGGGARGVQSPFLATVVAFFVGFGSGHAMVSARHAALLWLPLDAAVVIGAITAGSLTGNKWVWLVGLAGILTERALQAVSAYNASLQFDPVDDGNNRYDDRSEEEKRDRDDAQLDDAQLDDARGPMAPRTVVPALLLQGRF